MASGLDAVEITVLTSAWWGQPVDGYIRTRGWTPEQITETIGGLRERGLLEGDELTAEGLAVRDAIETATDRGQEGMIEALGGDAEELDGLLRPWASAIVAAKGYPVDPAVLVRR